jgi:hypothetical protein
MRNGLCGFVRATYNQLFEVLGQPQYGPDDLDGKSSCEWDMGDGASIYDYEGDESPVGQYYWHVCLGNLTPEDIEARTGRTYVPLRRVV